VRKFTYEGKFVAPMYISVGNKIESESRMTSTDLRKTVLVRGYQHDQGRALNALKSLEEIDEIKGFKVKIFSAMKSPAVILQAMRMKKSLEIDIQILPKMSHRNFLEEFKESRVYIGLSEADGLSTSMVEAMACGCFPIQSANSAASTFIVNGVNGFIVDPWDIPGIRECIRTSLRSDNLVREASALNVEIINRKYNWNTGIQKIKNLYSECILNTEDKTG
jgi:glycosyltransferase involved in cell wall biosynthesis